MSNIKKIVVVGGGTSGWMSAVALAKCLPAERYQITLVESDQIGTVGIGEATIPHIRFFNQLLGINESDFIKSTSATFKLGIEFQNWGDIGRRYFHPFGVFGQPLGRVPFYQVFTKLKQLNPDLGLDSYSLAAVAARAGRFQYPAAETDEYFASKYSYAFHFDAALYAQYLRKIAENKGVTRIEGIVQEVNKSPETGNIESLRVNDITVEGDLFIDCSGFRSLLLDKTLDVPFVDWSEWLPCDSALAVATENGNNSPSPYTKSIAHGAGWQWKIPLQHRTGNGYVYSSAFANEDEMYSQYEKKLDGKVLSSIRKIQFKAGRRQKSWEKNCIGIGLAGGFLEPLESTSIYLIQLAIHKLIEFFPENIDEDIMRDEFNRVITKEYENVRDFIILHYHLTQREDSTFWRYCKNMTVPDSLRQKMELFLRNGIIKTQESGLFGEPSWAALYFGQGGMPEKYPNSLDKYQGDISVFFAGISNTLKAKADKMPFHHDFISSLSKATKAPQGFMDLYEVFP